MKVLGGEGRGHAPVVRRPDGFVEGPALFTYDATLNNYVEVSPPVADVRRVERAATPAGSMALRCVS